MKSTPLVDTRVPHLAMIGERVWYMSTPNLKIWQNATVFFFASQERQYIMIKAKIGEEEYAVGILSHAKFGPGRRKGTGTVALKLKI